MPKQGSGRLLDSGSGGLLDVEADEEVRDKVGQCCSLLRLDQTGLFELVAQWAVEVAPPLPCLRREGEPIDPRRDQLVDGARRARRTGVRRRWPAKRD